MSLNCANEVAGIAQICEKKYPVQNYKGLLLLAPGFSLASAQELADRETVIGYIADQKIFPIQRLVSVENQDTEGSVEETSTQEKIFNYEGLRGAMYEAIMPLASHKIARTYNDIDWTIIYIDMKGTLIFKQNTNGTVQGLSTNLFHVWPLPTPSEVATKTKIQIQEANIDDLDVNGYYLNPTWDPKDLRGPLDITAVSSAIAANAFTLTLTYVNSGKKDADGTDLISKTAATGLLAADFDIWDQDGVLLTPTTDYTVTETSDGIYSVDATSAGMTSGQARARSTAEPLVKSNIVDVEA